MEKVAIFDLDGTVLDTQEDIADCMNKTIELFGYKKRSYAEYKQVIGNDASNFMRKLLGDLPTEKLMEIWRSYEKVYDRYGIVKTKLFDGINEVLIALKERGYKLAILTNKPQITTEDVYKKYLSRYEFDKVVGQSANVKCKPDKEAVLWILKDLNVLPENTYFVGDGETDVMVANNAELKGIAALWGYRDREILEQYGAKIFAKSPLDLLNLID